MAVPTHIPANDTETLDALFRVHYARVTRVIGRVIHDQARAEELAVEVFLKWWRSPPGQIAYPEGWLYRTAIRQAIDEWRSQGRRKRFERLFGFLGRPSPTPEQIHSTNVRQQQTRTVLASLSRRHAEALLLRSEDFSYQEIATSLALNPASVGSFISRAQDAFRKEYIKRYGNES